MRLLRTLYYYYYYFYIDVTFSTFIYFIYLFLFSTIKTTQALRYTKTWRGDLKKQADC